MFQATAVTDDRLSSRIDIVSSCSWRLESSPKRTTILSKSEENHMSDEILGRVSGGLDLSMNEMSSSIDAIMRGEWKDEQIALLLTALHQKGETVDEIAGAAEAMRRHMTRIRSDHDGLLDTCGTGGDVSGTFNISTAAALVIAAAGVPVAKHGNRRVTRSHRFGGCPRGTGCQH